MQSSKPMYSVDRHLILALTGAVLIATTLAPARAGERWPQFRGASGQGLSDEKNLPVTWGGENKENVLWQAPLPGEGHASAIVWDGKVFTCTVSWAKDVRDRAKTMPDHHVTCYSAEDGKQLWDTMVEPGPWLRSDFRSGAGGGYAGPTPTSDGKYVYCVFGSAVMAALDFDGRIVWRHDIKPYSFDVTIGGSPVLYKDTVVLLSAMANKKDSSLAALDKATGELKWRTPLPTVGFGHSTPLLIDVNGKPQILVCASGAGVTADGLQSFDPATGERLWWCRGGGDAATPAYGSGIVYFDSGRGGPGFAVDPTGAGNVTESHIKWNQPQVPEGIGSPIIVGGHVYRLHSPGVLKCWDAKTGDQVYAERLQGITSTWASPVADVNGRLYFASGGKSIVVQSGPKFEVLATNDLGDANHASAAVANGRLFIVGMKQLHCIGKK